MYYLIYSSYAAVDFDYQLLMGLLAKAQNKNTDLQITGMLLYFDNKFIQLIEGPEQAVRKLYQDIQDDERHTDVLTLKEGSIGSRYYPDWSMSFKQMAVGNITEQDGFLELEGAGFNNELVIKLFKILNARAAN